MRKANAIREQFIYCNKSMRRRGPGYGEPAPKKLKDQPRPLDYKLYEPWKDGEKAQRHPRVTDPPTHPPVAGAQLEAAWGGQQRHGLQSNPAGGMEPEAWQKLKQLRCKRKLQHRGRVDADALVPEGAGRVLAAASRRMKQSVKSRS